MELSSYYLSPPRYPRTWIKQADYPELAFSPSLRAFTTQRAELLAVLSPLLSEAWTRSAQVSLVGKAIDRTVLNYVEWMTVYERSHIKQITYIVNTMHTRKRSEDS